MAKVLPNAPLVEVVFELRWALATSEQTSPLGVDPGYSLLKEEFSHAIKRSGFRHHRNMQPSEFPILGHSVDRRFFRSPEQAFPLVQIGPGIFAYNESADYSWTNFKANCLKHVDSLLKCYPTLSSFKLAPALLELRYVDSFEHTLPNGKPANFFEYMHTQTNFGVSIPTMPAKLKGIQDDPTGRLIAEYALKGKKETAFTVDFASGQRKGAKILRMETKVRSLGKDLPSLSNRTAFKKKAGQWLEQAHSVISPFFIELLGPQRLARYK